MDTIGMTDRPGCPLPYSVQLLTPGNWWELRSVRLDALQEAPTAFIAKLDDEKEFPDERWEARLKNSTWAVARQDDQFVGVAKLTVGETPVPSGRFIESVWVRPDHRGHGHTEQMLALLEQHAHDDNATQLMLWVLHTNKRALNRYLELGFVLTEVRQPTDVRTEAGSVVDELLMTRPIPYAAARGVDNAPPASPRKLSAAAVLATLLIPRLRDSHSRRSSAHALR